VVGKAVVLTNRIENFSKLRDETASPLLLLGFRSRGDDSSNGFVEHVFQTLLCESRTLHVLDGLDLLRHGVALFGGDGRELLLCKAVESLLILTHIELGSDQDHGCVRAMVLNFRDPFRTNVFERSGRDDRETDKEDVCLGIGERSKSIVIFLPSSIPETKIDGFVVDHDVRRVVVEYCGDVFAREGVRGVRNQQTSFTDGSVSYNDTFDGLHLFCFFVFFVCLSCFSSKKKLAFEVAQERSRLK